MKMANPYLNRTTIKDERDFIGRRRELATVFSRVGAGEPQSVSVVGERRIGKSSLLRALWRRFRGSLPRPDEYVFACIDLQEMMHGDVSSFFRVLLDEISQILNDETIAQQAPTYESIRRTVSKLARFRLTLVLLLDEFDAVTGNPNFGLEFFSFLRSLPNNHAVSFIVTSSRELQEICHSREVAGSPFFNIFHKLNLACFPPEEALELITRPSQLAGCPLESYAAEILQLAGRFPMFLQIACSTYFEFLYDHAGQQPDRTEMKLRYRDEASDHFSYMWHHLTERERLVCRKLYFGELLSTADYSFAQVLIRRGYLEQTDNGLRLFSDAFAEHLGTCLECPSSEISRGLIGSLVGRFKVKEQLGQGGMGEVFLAEDTKLKRLVALKRLRPDHCDDPVWRQRFSKEAERASQLSDSNIAMLYDVMEQNGAIYLVMEYIAGRSLRQRSKEQVSLAELLDIAIQVSLALVSAHGLGIVHCDIKPENIMITPDGRVKVLDFGVARKIYQTTPTQSTLTLEASFGCTLEYGSPELLQHHEPDGRSDIFSLGVVLYELVAGQHPFRSSRQFETIHNILYTDPPRLTDVNLKCPPQLNDIICRCLAKNPGDRYQEAKALLAAVQSIRLRIPQAQASPG